MAWPQPRSTLGLCVSEKATLVGSVSLLREGH